MPAAALGAFAAAARLADRRAGLAEIGGRDRQQRLHGRDLPRRRDELRVSDVEPVDRALNVQLDVLVGQHLDLVELGPVLELGVGRVRRQLAEPEVADPALAGDLERRLDSLGLVVLVASQRRAQDVAVVAAGQPAVAREHQQQRLLDRVAAYQQRVATSPRPVSPRSATSSAILRVNASASVARFSALRNRLVAISSIVRVILRMFSTALRRLMIARALAIEAGPALDSDDMSDSTDRLALALRGRRVRRSQRKCFSLNSAIAACRSASSFGVSFCSFSSEARKLGLPLADEREERRLPARDVRCEARRPGIPACRRRCS